MKVFNLISALFQCNPQADVLLECRNSNTLNGVYEMSNDDKSNIIYLCDDITYVADDVSGNLVEVPFELIDTCPLSYIEIRNIFKATGLDVSIRPDIVSAVIASLESVDEPVSDDMFVAICSYVYNMWTKADTGYVQLMADVVVNCIYHCFEDSFCSKITLTYEDLCSLNHYRDTVMDAYLEKYYN